MPTTEGEKFPQPEGGRRGFRFLRRRAGRPPSNLDDDFVEDPQKRKFLKKALVTGAGVAVGLTLGGGIDLYKLTSQAKDALQEAMDFLYDVPNEIRLLFDFPGLNEHIKIPHALLKKVKFYCVGDSMNVNHGIRHDSEKGYQEYSHIQQVVDTVNTRSKEQNPDDPAYQWEAANWAVPGAATGNEDPRGNDMLGSRQLGNPDFIKDMMTYEGTPIVVYSPNGNDWKQQIATQSQSVQDSNMIENLPKVKKSFVDSQIQKYNQIKSSLGDNSEMIFSKFEEVNNYRLAHNLTPLRVVVIMPASYRRFTVVPFGTREKYSAIPQGLTVSNNKNLKQAIYLVTCGIFDELRKVIPKFNRRVHISAISKFGLEKPGELMDPTKKIDRFGHFNELGHQDMGQNILRILEDVAPDGSSQTFTDMDYIIPKPPVYEWIDNEQGIPQLTSISAE